MGGRSRERRLLPAPSSSLPSARGAGATTTAASVIHAANAAAPRADAHVAGIVPEPIYDALSSSSSIPSSSGPPTTTGRIDPTGTGLAFLLVNGNEGGGGGGGGRIDLWPHATHTLSEEIDQRPSECCAFVVHPEYSEEGGDRGGGGGPLTKRLVALAPHSSVSGGGGALFSPGGRRSSSAASGGGAIGGGGGGLYACSPSGVLCHWIDPLASSRRHHHRYRQSTPTTAATATSPPCDASVRLPLRRGERVTSVEHVDAAAHTGGATAPVDVLVGTSRGRIWAVRRTSRPLELRARSLRPIRRRRRLIEENEEEGSGGRGGTIRGFVSGLIFGSAHDDGEEDEEDDEGVEDYEYDKAADEEDSEETERTGGVDAVHSLLPVAVNVGEEGGGSVMTSTRRPPSRDVTLPSPRKVPRTTALPGAGAATAMSFVSVTNSGKLSLWTLLPASSKGSAAGDEDGAVGRGRGTSRWIESLDGILDVGSSGILDSRPLGDTASSEERVDTNTEVVASASSTDGRFIVLVVRIVPNGVIGETAEGRLYLVQVAVGSAADISEGGQGDSPLRLVRSTWLSRYAGRSVATGLLDCAGLVLVGGNDNGVGGGDENDDEYVAYAAFYHRLGANDGDAEMAPVTFSSVHLPSLSSSGFSARCHDVDLPSDPVSSLVYGTVTTDESARGGCACLTADGIVVAVRVLFPRIASTGAAAAAAGEAVHVDAAEVTTVQTHLLSAFRAYRHQRRRRAAATGGGSGGGGDSTTDASVRSNLPPSIYAASSPCLSEATVGAASVICCGGGGMGVGGGGGGEGKSPLELAQDRLSIHAEYVNFLVHAGAYRRVLTRGRVLLRDLGEKLSCAAGMLELWRDVLEDHRRRRGRGRATPQKESYEAIEDEEEDRRERDAVASILAGLEDDAAVDGIPARWSALQQDVLGVVVAGGDGGDGSVAVVGAKPLDRVSSLLCKGLGAALRYRWDMSDMLYDLPGEDVVVGSAAPWTSGSSVLSVARQQLVILGAGPSSLDGAGTGATWATYVEQLAFVLLNGHRALAELRNEGLYDEAKQITVPLLRSAVGNSAAFRSSLDHAYFEGICSISHDHHRSGGTAEEKEDQVGMYELGPMLDDDVDEPSLSSSPYAHLHLSIDRATRLTFRQYVLKWHADRGLFADVLDLGRRCPLVLDRYLQEDDRLRDYRWIHHTRMGRHGDASFCLVGFVEDGGTKTSLQERSLALSLAKLANKIAREEEKDGTIQGEVVGRLRSDEKMIDRNLSLSHGQEMLREMVDDDVKAARFDIAMTAGELLQAALEHAEAERGNNEMAVKACLIGLAASEAMDGGTNGDASARGAARVWARCILSDMETWKGLVLDGMDMPDYELRNIASSTVFCGVTEGYSGERELGFLTNERIRAFVAEYVGHEEYERMAGLLMDSAEAAVRDAVLAQ